VVLAGLTTLFVSGSNGEIDMNRRFAAQQEARVALDMLRRDVHCSSQAAPGTNATTLLLTDPCATGGYVSWCTAAISGTSWYGLYRNLGATCNSSVTLQSGFLVGGNVFGYTQQSTLSLAKVHVDIQVNLNPLKARESYTLADDIVARNSARLCVVASPSTIASPSPPC
jgi:hypothetical protein